MTTVMFAVSKFGSYLASRTRQSQLQLSQRLLQNLSCRILWQRPSNKNTASQAFIVRDLVRDKAGNRPQHMVPVLVLVLGSLLRCNCIIPQNDKRSRNLSSFICAPNTNDRSFADERVLNEYAFEFGGCYLEAERRQYTYIDIFSIHPFPKLRQSGRILLTLYI